MNEIEELRQQLAEEQRRRLAAEDSAKASQRLREEEQRRRKEEHQLRLAAEDSAKASQRLREEEQRLREEEQRLREEEKRRREEEQQRRLAAERLAEASQPQNLGQYLESCHSLSLAINVITDRSLTTQGDATDPTGRVFPRRIIPWDAFPYRQEEVWGLLSDKPTFSTEPSFASKHQIDYVMSLIEPISSEIGLRAFERDTVENAVKKLVDYTSADPTLREKLDLQGTVTFESHTNLGNSHIDISESFEHLSIAGKDLPPTSAASRARPRPHSRRSKPNTKRRGNLADQFCIYRASDGRNIPTLAIEYKAPHKLTREACVSGLQSEIRPERDIINKTGEGFEFASKSLAAAVITQLFSYMIGKGIQYGYISTGEVFVFLHIPADPTKVYYSLCVPNLDVMADDESRLHRTAVAQVFAFVLRALRAEPPSAAWHDAAADLSTWAVEYDDVLRNIPVTDRKDPYASPYKAQRWKGFQRSAIRTRSRCKHAETNGRQDSDSDRDYEDSSPPSPTMQRVTRSKAKASMANQSSRKQSGQDKNTRTSTKRTRITERPYCTDRCLLALAYGGPLDRACPNLRDHGARHISRLEFLQLTRCQLATDRGSDADCTPLYMSGRVGSLFKIRLTSHGYTFVAKGVEKVDLPRIQHEKSMYDRLRKVQGQAVPVCLGTIEAVLPLYCDGGVYKHLLFLSWAGQCLVRCVRELDYTAVVKGMNNAYALLHDQKVVQKDVALRNMLYNEESGKCMVVDFERAEFYGREPLGLLNSHNQMRKRKRTKPIKPPSGIFLAEMETVRAELSSYQ